MMMCLLGELALVMRLVDEHAPGNVSQNTDAVPMV